MERELFGSVIRQKHKSEMLSATDLINAYNKNIIAETGDVRKAKEFRNYKKLSSTIEFIETLEEELGSDTKLIQNGKDNWVHPYVFLDIALWLNPKFKAKVYKWLYDSLLINRDISGNSYNKLSGIVFKHKKPFGEAKSELKSIATAIQVACDISSSKKNKWESATEEQLSLRNRIHDYICLMYPILGDDAVDLAITKAKEDEEIQKQ